MPGASPHVLCEASGVDEEVERGEGRRGCGEGVKN